jgi:putative heme-binding domain-containing protein
MKLSRIAALIVCFFPLLATAEPQWIWLNKKATANEKVRLSKAFEVAGEVKSASLKFTCDNGAKASLNGKPAGDCADWNMPVTTDAKGLLQVGRNELVLDARNETGAAAAVAVLTIELTSGDKMVVETGADWQAAPGEGSGETKEAVVIAKYGARPWGDILNGEKPLTGRGPQAAQAPTDPATLKVPAGFKVELLYTVPKAEQGSWVAITVDAKGRLITSDQQGGLYRVTVPPLGGEAPATGIVVEPLTLPNGSDGKPLGGAHGLLYAFDSLYLMVNEKNGKGLWRVRDTDGDDQFDQAEHLRKCDGGGEHGPHSVQLGPDGKSLFFCDGNHTKLPENMELSRAARVWGEDHITPRMWDANGHAKGILAPGGHICKTDPDGKVVELYSYGFRNEFDFAFDANGELFTYDSDMEWDIGTPWYRPTRIVHATSGGDYGWRSGAGKWPAYYADSLPPSLDVGPGSPTGVVFGTGAKFPAKYQRAFYACDWTYGTMYAIHPTPAGASFRVEKEEFVAGKAMPLTDVVIHPQDGAMYFTIGGRKTQSALYRVTYQGSESTAPAPRVELTPEAKLRRQLEALHVEGTGPEAVEKAWPHLAHADRFVRWAARVAIERQPAGNWAQRALAENNPQAALEALVALARCGDAALQPQLIGALEKLDFNQTAEPVRLSLLRAWQLAFTRMGKPEPEVRARILAKLDPLFPSADPLINRELVQLLVFLESTSVVPKTVPLLAMAADAGQSLATDELLARNEGYARAAQAMAASRPNRQAMAYAYALRVATAGWTPELRKTYFGWFPRTREWKGGNSFSKFIENIRTESLANFVPEGEERIALDEMSKAAPPAPPANLTMPKGPGKAYTVDDVVALAQSGLKGRNFEQGKAMFAATMCAACHHFAGEGGNVGPDLTGAGNRYTIRDLVENIVEPSKVISDQYGSEQLELKNGSVVIGRVVVEENGKIFVMSNPFAPDAQTAVEAKEVSSRKPFSVSMMPPNLINALNADELLDLLAYLLSGGKAEDKAFGAR